MEEAGGRASHLQDLQDVPSTRCLSLNDDLSSSQSSSWNILSFAKVAQYLAASHHTHDPPNTLTLSRNIVIEKNWISSQFYIGHD